MEHFTSNRRGFLRTAAAGFGYTAFAGLAAMDALRANGTENPLSPRAPHFEPKAKRVIFLFMQGGPTQHDTFDYNPLVANAAGKHSEMELSIGKQGGKILAPVFEFLPGGESGLPISTAFPHLREQADDLCLLNGMHTDSPAHPQASIFTHTGSVTFVRPSIGSWVVYGLGTENQDLPGFVTINPPAVGGASLYGSAFLPASYQGTRINVAEGQDPVENIRNARMGFEAQRKQIDFVQRLNRGLVERTDGNDQVEGVIQSYELAFRMQSAVPEAMDLATEPESVRSMYGLDQKETRTFGTQCLLARRMAEKGVRFIELGQRGWDHHNNLRKRLQASAESIDKPIAALIADLKQRGMLDETLIVWGGEFGRSSYEQNDKGDGRRHNNRGYTMWMAGGGVKGGMRYGRCDEHGVAVEDRTHLHDLHATILNQLGLDHTKLTYRYAGRDFRLTDVHGRVVKEILT